MMLILPPDALAIRTPINTGPKNWGHATATTQKRSFPGHPHFHRSRCSTNNRDFLLQILDPLLRGRQLASISTTHATDQPLPDTPQSPPSMQV